MALALNRDDLSVRLPSAGHGPGIDLIVVTDEAPGFPETIVTKCTLRAFGI
jgi:hypothetical protein